MKKILTLSTFKVLNFSTLVEMAVFLEVDTESMEKLIKKAETEYTPIWKLKKNGVDYRTIHAPSSDLKRLQSLIYTEFLSRVSLPSCVYGHSQGRTIVENAKYHSKSRHLLNVDIVDFFPSIRYTKVQKLFTELLQSEGLATELTKLVTYKGVLPQGSPASPYLSALILNNLDRRLMAFCKTRGLRYTRYFDDITISGNRPLVSIEEQLFNIITTEGFKVHKQGNKISRFGPGEVKTVTGIQIMSDGLLSVGNPSEFENYINLLKTNGVQNQGFESLIKEKQILQGKIAFLSQVMPALAQKIKISFDLIDWGI